VRAQEILADVALIICEDTRSTQKLLGHFHIRTPLVSLPAYKENPEACQKLLEPFCQGGQANVQVALVSDAGSPAVSDPGAHVVAAAHGLGMAVKTVPGPSSLPAALGACGFLAPRAVFSGFLPRIVREQHEEFTRWQACAPCVAVAFESPQRILDTLKSLEDFFGPQGRVCVSREMSKMFEEHIRGPLSEVRTQLVAKDRQRGEFTLCVYVPEALSQTHVPSQDELRQKIQDLQKQFPTLRLKELCHQAALGCALSAKEIYKRMAQTPSTPQEDSHTEEEKS
jgi:16S rRNA (cytidine1402-2'-O)-methyltransferase